MGKLQEALRKIRIKARSTATFAEKLSIPLQMEPVGSEIPPDANAIKQWIIACDAANSMNGNVQNASCADTLLQALQRSNRTDCLPDVRLQIMQEYEKPFTRAVQSLDRCYLYLDFPLTMEAEQNFKTAATLCREMAFGYKIAVIDSFKGSAKSRKVKTETSQQVHSKGNSLSRAKRSQAIGCACTHLTELTLRHAQIYRDWPDHIWTDFHALMNIAVRDNTSNKTDQTLFGLQHLSIEQQYGCLCALYVMDQKKLKPEDIRSLLVKLGRHADLLKLHSSPTMVYKKSANNKTESEKSKSNNSQTSIYSVGEYSAPLRHEFQLPRSSNTLLHFSLDAIIEKLAAEGDCDTIVQACRRINRVESRTPRTATIKIETGLENIHQIINSAPPQENTDAQYTNLTELLAQQQVESAAELQADYALLDQTTPSTGTASFQVENQSAHGFGLKWTGNGPCAVQIGELVAHKYKNKDHEVSWHLSIVRWLRTYADGTLRLGVESLSRHTNAVDIVRWINPKHKSETSIDGLLINYQPIDSNAKMLILPRLKYKTGETVGYRDKDGFHIVKLIENVDIHADYQCFATQEIEEKSTPHIDSHIIEYQVAL